ncbi:MAG: M20/M25/M40 family metallo-hydrolase [Spirochaetaceae bacterium]|nr:M20/M25/M40 family metallo-hydrolase [Spirochaetaceae bacterium]
MLGIVKKYEKEWISFTQEAVRIPSIIGTEGELANFFLKNLKDIGIKECFIDEAGNVVGVIRGSGKGPNIMFNGHLDTVPTGMLSQWTPYGPFDAAIDDKGNLIGLGVCDMKAGLTAQFIVFKIIYEAVKQNKITLPGDLIFTCVVNEESVGMLGMQYLLENTMPKHNLKCDIVYLSEPTSNNLALGHRGKVEIIVKTVGKTAHSSAPHLGINAFEKMLPVADTIFHKMGSSLKSDPILGDSSITITNCVVRPGTLSITPDECEIYVDRRYMPGETFEEIIEGFNKLFRELSAKDEKFKATAEPRMLHETTWTGYKKSSIKYHPPWRVDKDSDFVKKTFAALKSVGQDPKEYYWKGGTDGSMSCSIHKIPTIGYSGAEIMCAHQPNEYVNINETLKTLDGYISIVCSLMNLDINVFK